MKKEEKRYSVEEILKAGEIGEVSMIEVRHVVSLLDEAKKTINMINKTTKRLLSASRLGINFDYGDGHRWINFYEDEVTDNETMYQKLQRNNIHPNTKVYGNIIDCLNFIDFLLKKMNEPILEERFDGFNDWGFDDEFVGNHTPWEYSGSETDEYFEERI